jgi:hypothetical protein
MCLAAWMCKPISVGALVAAVERHRLRRPSEWPASAAHPAHSMQFYDGDDQLVAAVADFLAPAVIGSDPVAVIATAEHWQQFEARLVALGCDPVAGRADGRIQVFDARQALESLMVDGVVVENRFTDEVCPLVAGASRGPARLRVYGEMVDLLWREGDLAGVVLLEQCWNRLLASVPCDLHCAYAVPLTDLHRGSIAWVRQQHADPIAAAV